MEITENRKAIQAQAKEIRENFRAFESLFRDLERKELSKGTESEVLGILEKFNEQIFEAGGDLDFILDMEG